MNSKLTLWVDDKTIRRAKKYAQRRNISISKLVEQFFASVNDGNEKIISSPEISPWVKSISGIIPFLSETEIKSKIRQRMK